MIKKSICLVIGFCMLFTQAFAQNAENNFLSLNNSAAASVYYQRHYEVSPQVQYAVIQNKPGETLRNVGLGLLGLGGVLLISGIALVATNPISSSYYGSSSSAEGFAWGVVAIVYCVPAFVAGGILTGIGAKKMKKHKEQEKHLITE